MTVVDASVMVSALHPADINHDLCRTWLSQQIAARTPLAAPYLLLSELAGSIARVTGQPSAGHVALATVLAIPTLTFVPYLDEPPTLAATLASDLRLRGADATYVAIASQLGMDLVSLDKEQLERGGQYVVTRRPSVS
jgi:predicted nucleic acid-binding protein